MSISLNKHDLEASIRREAQRLGETVLALRWEGDDPVVTLDTKGRETDEVKGAAGKLLQAAIAPVARDALAKSLKGSLKLR